MLYLKDLKYNTNYGHNIAEVVIYGAGKSCRYEALYIIHVVKVCLLVYQGGVINGPRHQFILAQSIMNIDNQYDIS